MKISIYSTATCGYCNMLKNWLKENNQDFTEYRVDLYPQAAQAMVLLSGQMGVPFSTVEKDDGEVVKILGFDRPKFEEVLAKN